jgi:hypothetical protein
MANFVSHHVGQNSGLADIRFLCPQSPHAFKKHISVPSVTIASQKRHSKDSV